MTNQSQDIPLVGRVTKNLLGLSQERAEQLEYFAMTKEVFPAYDGANDPNFTEGEKWFRMVFGELSPAELRQYHAEVSDFQRRALDREREANISFWRGVCANLADHRRGIWNKLAPPTLPFPGWVARRILLFHGPWLEKVILAYLRGNHPTRWSQNDFYNESLRALLGKEVFEESFARARARLDAERAEEYQRFVQSKQQPQKTVQEVWAERRREAARKGQL